MVGWNPSGEEREGKQQVLGRLAACFTTLADLRAPHHPAAACLMEGTLDREAGFTLSREKKKKNRLFVKPRHWGFG